MSNFILDTALGYLKIIFPVARTKKFAPNYFCIVVFSCSQMFFKIGFLKNFENFTGKQLCWSL